MRALVIANAGDDDPGFVGDELRRRGYVLVEARREHPDGWPALDGFDTVLTLGSEWSAYSPHVAHLVEAEMSLVQAARRTGVPLFGICFGHQVMAQAFGGSVCAGPGREIGWVEVDSADPEAIAGGPWLQWHGDVVVVPPGAAELARNGFGPQAWRLGRCLATQFHPEATEAMLARWTATGTDELTEVGLTAADLMTATRVNVAVSAPNAARLVQWFCEHVAGAMPAVASAKEGEATVGHNDQ